MVVVSPQHGPALNTTGGCFNQAWPDRLHPEWCGGGGSRFGQENKLIFSLCLLSPGRPSNISEVGVYGGAKTHNRGRRLPGRLGQSYGWPMSDFLRLLRSFLLHGSAEATLTNKVRKEDGERPTMASYCSRREGKYDVLLTNNDLPLEEEKVPAGQAVSARLKWLDSGR